MKIFGKLAEKALFSLMTIIWSYRSFPNTIFQVSTFVGFVPCHWVVLEHFKMYIIITEIVREKRIDLAYSIWGKEVAVVSMFSDNVQDKGAFERNASERGKVAARRGVYGNGALNLSVGRKAIILPDVHNNIVKMDKLASIITKMSLA